MIKKTLNLEYTLSPGWMQPWVDGLMRGEAIARACRGCGFKSFAPMRVCTCGCADGEWVKLKGEATIVRQTAGSDGHFAMARFDGADNDVVARLDSFLPLHHKGQLKAPSGGVPQLILEPLEGESG